MDLPQNKLKKILLVMLLLKCGSNYAFETSATIETFCKIEAENVIIENFEMRAEKNGKSVMKIMCSTNMPYKVRMTYKEKINKKFIYVLIVPEKTKMIRTNEGAYISLGTGQYQLIEMTTVFKNHNNDKIYLFKEMEPDLVANIAY